MICNAKLIKKKIMYITGEKQLTILLINYCDPIIFEKKLTIKNSI